MVIILFMNKHFTDMEPKKLQESTGGIVGLNLSFSEPVVQIT